MPIGLSPNNRVTVYLESDRASYPDEKTRPGFVCKFLTCDDHIRIGELIASIDGVGRTDKEAGAILDQVVGIGVVGWVNMPADCGDYDAAKLPSLLTFSERWELVNLMQVETRIAESDRKKSASRQRSGSVDSAPAAATAASTSPPPTDPPLSPAPPATATTPSAPSAADADENITALRVAG